MKYLDILNNQLKKLSITKINKISTRLLRLEFKSGNITKSNAIIFIVKKHCLIISNNGNVLRQL